MAATIEAARTCVDCGQSKIADEFYLFHGKTRDNRCKSCRNKLSYKNKKEKDAAAQEQPKLEPAAVTVSTVPEARPATKQCNSCHKEKPLSEFYMRQTDSGPKPFARCKQCDYESRIIRLRDEPKKERRGAGEAVVCAAHHYLCGDPAFLEVFPDFYEDHIRPVKGQEWQVCRNCGAAKLVDVYGSQKTLAVEPPQMRHLVSERATSLPAEERALPKPPELTQVAPEGIPFMTNGHSPAPAVDDQGDERADGFEEFPTTPLGEAPPPGEDQARWDLHLRLAEQEELIEELRGQLASLERRARIIIEADQAGWKARIAAKDRALATVVERLRKAERLIAYTWGTTRGIEESARRAGDLLEAYEQG